MRPAAPLAAVLLCALAAGCSGGGDESVGTDRAVRAAALITPSTTAVSKVASAVAATAAPAASASASTKTCRLPSSSIFRADVTRLPAPSTSGWQLHGTSHVHADFGSGTWEGRPIGIPITKVTSAVKPVSVRFDYAGESDRGGYAIGKGVKIEGGANADGDRHALLLNTGTCALQELFALRRQSGRWAAGSGAKFRLNSNKKRPLGWTSADAAGLPIQPLLVTYADVARGDVGHAIRVTMPATAQKYVWPASHKAGQAGVAGPPMGAWFRLKSGVSTAGLGKQAKVIVKAMKKYGVVVADNGAPWFISGAPDHRWNNDDLHTLDRLQGSDFQAVNVAGLKVSSTSYARRG